MDSVIVGSRRHLGSDRWITYAVVWYEGEDGASVRCLAALSEDSGPCLEAPGAHVKVMPGFTAGETAQALVCHFIDTQPIRVGQQPNPGYRAYGRRWRALF